MSRVIGYMLTWSTYGSWLQGDRRGWVKDGNVFEGNEKLLHSNALLQKDDTFRLNRVQKEVVGQAIRVEAERLGQKIFAVVVWSNHVHVVVNNIDETVGAVAGRYKSVATRALKGEGIDGKVLTENFHKKYCFSEAEMKQKIDYVDGHGE